MIIADQIERLFMPTKDLTGTIVIRRSSNEVDRFLPEKSFDLRNALAKLITDNAAKYDFILATCRVELRIEELKHWEYQYDALLLEVEVDSYDGMQDARYIANELLVLWRNMIPNGEGFGIRMRYRDIAYVSCNKRP